MQVRDIKNQKTNQRLSQKQMETLATRFRAAFKRAGFQTSVFHINTSRIDIKGGNSGVSNKYATIDVKKHGHNYRVNSFTAYHCKLGYKRTNGLTWDQRVKLNSLINDVLDKANVSCRVQSRGFEVRSKENGRVDNYDIETGWDSFQVNYLDWIYSDETEAKEAFDYHYAQEVTERKMRDDAARTWFAEVHMEK